MNEETGISRKDFLEKEGLGVDSKRVVARNLKRRKEGMEWVKVPGLGNGKAQGIGERRKPACRKGFFRERSGNSWKGRVGPQSQGLECQFRSLISYTGNENTALQCFQQSGRTVFWGNSCFREMQKRGCQLG